MGRSRALVTIVRNEAVFFPIWLRYYRQFFAPEDIFVFDHSSTDNSTEVGGFVRELVTHDTVDHTWMRETIQAKQHELIERYDTVLVTDADEIVAPDPERYGDLGHFIDTFSGDFVNCHGYEVLHNHLDEPPIELDQPILAQRGWWFPNFAYSKPLLAKVPMNWFDGFHARRDGLANLSEDLRLIHLHRMDYEICRERHRYRSRVAWNERDLASHRGYQNLITAEDRFENWFYNDSCTHLPIEQEAIPSAWRTVA